MPGVDDLNAVLRRVPAWPVYLVGLAPMVWLFALAVTGRLGVEPVEALEHRYGLLGLQFFIAAMCVSPLRRFLGLNMLRHRRALGLVGFYYVCAHLSVWLVLDVQSLGAAWQDVVKRPYITVGMAGFVLLTPLAVTSNDWCCRRLGPLWRQLHRLTYPAVLLGAAHYVMLAKGWQWEPVIYLAIVAALVALRALPRRRARALRVS